MMVVVVYDLGGCLVLHLLVDGTSIFNWSTEITGVACALLYVKLSENNRVSPI